MFEDWQMESLFRSFVPLVIKPPPVTVNSGQSAAGTDGKSVEASDLYYRLLNQLTVCLNWEPYIRLEQIQCICMFVYMRHLKGVCTVETRRRLITSSSFAVSWLHLDGSVHLEEEKEMGGQKKERRKRRKVQG